MAIQLKYNGKNDKAGQCEVTIRGKTKSTGDGEQGRILALIEIEAFEKGEVERKELMEAYDDMVAKSVDGFVLRLWEPRMSPAANELPEAAIKSARYEAYIDGEEVYKGDDLQELRNRVSNIPDSSFGP